MMFIAKNPDAQGTDGCSRERVIEDRSSPPIPIQQVAQTLWMISGANPPYDIGVYFF
jgi:hypothetical protein